jgi:hypothetical protein
MSYEPDVAALKCFAKVTIYSGIEYGYEFLTNKLCG